MRRFLGTQAGIYPLGCHAGDTALPRLAQSAPKYRKHKASAQAFVELKGRRHYLGPHGTKASRIEYDRLIAEWLASGRQLLLRPSELTVIEIVARYWAYVRERHVRDDRPTDEQANIKAALRPLLRLYQDQPATSIGPLALRVVQRAMVKDGLARSTINERIARIKRLFKWAVAEKLLPVEIHQSLTTVEGLRRGQTSAKETSPVQPVDDAIVEATLPFLPDTVADMVRVQRWTGCRPRGAGGDRVDFLHIGYTRASEQGWHAGSTKLNLTLKHWFHTWVRSVLALSLLIA